MGSPNGLSGDPWMQDSTHADLRRSRSRAPGGRVETHRRSRVADTARAARAAPLRRDAVLETVAFAAERLLMAADWHDVALEVLARLGIAAEVSRACITENATDTAGRLCSTLVCEWCA